MTNSFINIYEKQLRVGQEQSFQKKILLQYLNKKGIEASLLKQELQCLLSMQIETQGEYLAFIRQSVGLVSLCKLIDFEMTFCQPLWKKAYISPFNSSQLAKIYLFLLKFFCEIKEQEVSKLEPLSLLKNDLVEKDSYSLYQAIESCVILFFYASLKEDAFLSKEASIFANKLLPFFDENSYQFFPLWLKQDEYHFAHQQMLTYLFFYLLSHGGDQKLQGKAKAMEESLCSFCPQSLDQIPLHFVSLIFLFQNKGDLASSFFQQLGDESPNHAFIGYDKNLSYAFTFSGNNTSLGSIQKKEVGIESFGPQYAPIDDSKIFGIYSLANEPGNYEKTEYGFHADHWVRLMGEGGLPGLDWMHVDLAKNQNAYQLGIMPQIKDSKPLFFAFFVKANHILIDENIKLSPHSLQRYEGKCKNISLFGQNESLEILAKDFYFSKIFPLAGENYFWRSDFLIAFELSNKIKKYFWKIN